MRVAYFGTWERGYPRNDQVIACLREAGVDVEEVHAPLWRSEHKFAIGASAVPRIAAAEMRLALRRVPEHVDALVVGYPGQFDIPSARIHRRPLVFNAMVSLYETFVEDRKRFAEGSLAARALRALDRRAFRWSDLVVSDTAANAVAMGALAGLDRVEHCFVGADETLFTPAWQPRDDFHVLFVGKLIPLHGLRTILDAARLLPHLPFRVIGSGQEQALLRDAPPNVEHVPWVEYEGLHDEYARAGCALGIFGPGQKPQRVIPNKVFQALATATPVITADTPAVRELLADERDALLVPVDDAAALAAAVERLRGDRALAARLSASGLAAFRARASSATLGKRWRELIEETIDAHR
jgi:glycosyltransferase involved in cell wall biosynthesis